MPETLTHAGPDELLRLKAQYLMPCVYHFYQRPPHIVAGEGCYLFDHEGRRYLDCYAGVTVMNAGHANPFIIDRAIAQLRSLQHTTSIYLTEPTLRLAEALAEITPGALKRSFFCASGTEAVEGALLTAALHTRRRHIIATTNGLHGRTRWAINATGLDMWRTDPFPLHEVHHVPFGDDLALARKLEQLEGKVSAFIAEPIQGNGGIVVPEQHYWPDVRQLCVEHNVLLILDEIQTGMNRTGRWFASYHWDVTPDILVTSKGLGNGFPIAAFITTDTIAESYTRPGASTFGGNPLCAAAALATIEFHRAEHLDQRARHFGHEIRTRLTFLLAGDIRFQPPRGMGLMIGLPVVEPNGAPAPGVCDLLLEDLKDHGVLAGKTGPDRNVITLMPPLTISQEQTGELLTAFERVLA